MKTSLGVNLIDIGPRKQNIRLAGILGRMPKAKSTTQVGWFLKAMTQCLPTINEGEDARTTLAEYEECVRKEDRNIRMDLLHKPRECAI